MPRVTTERRVPFRPAQMFALVADVEKYPDFLPLCESLHVRSRREREGRALLVAEMVVGYKALRERFTTQVLLDAEKRTIDTSYVDGPFRVLNGRWTFEPTPESGTVVRFDIEYEFKSRILAALTGGMFDRAFRMFAEAFEKRAYAVYGKAEPGGAEMPSVTSSSA